MASKFKVWIDSPTVGTNIQSYENFIKDGQRTSGFSTGSVASSIRVNSALRQANLVAVALMNSMLPNSSCDLTSTVDALVSEINAYFSQFATNAALTAVKESLGTQVTYSLSGTTLTITTK